MYSFYVSSKITFFSISCQKMSQNGHKLFELWPFKVFDVRAHAKG